MSYFALLKIGAVIALWTSTAGATGPDDRAGSPEFLETAGGRKYTRQVVTYKVVDGDSLKLGVMHPVGDDRCPLILSLHAGGLIMGGQPELESLSPGPRLSRFLEAGYAVATVGYRVAPEHKLPEIVADVTDSYAWIRSNGPSLFSVDPDRIALFGRSAGAYLSLLAGARLNPRPRSIVAFYGPTDISGTWITDFRIPPPERRVKLEFINWPEEPISREEANGFLKGPDRFKYVLYCYQQGIWPMEVTGRDPAVEPEWFHSYEPVRLVSEDYPPTVLLYGEADTAIPVTQGTRMAAELEKFGVEHRLLTFPGYGHMFDEDWSHLSDPPVQEAYATILSFYERHFK